MRALGIIIGQLLFYVYIHIYIYIYIHLSLKFPSALGVRGFLGLTGGGGEAQAGAWGAWGARAQDWAHVHGYARVAISIYIYIYICTRKCFVRDSVGGKDIYLRLNVIIQPLNANSN